MLLSRVGTVQKQAPRGWMGSGLTASSIDPYYYSGGLVSDFQAVSGRALVV